MLNGNDKVVPSDYPGLGARALTEAEIVEIIQGFEQATDLAIRAGFDGVEIHGANTYLIQQFYTVQTNRRSDAWGGSLEKRMAFPLAVVDVVVEARAEHQLPDYYWLPLFTRRAGRGWFDDARDVCIDRCFGRKTFAVFTYIVMGFL